MTIIIFIVVLALLIFVHELGHFLAAKATGMRVDEFGIGFPPKLFSWRRGETLYSLNLIPFGGFVKIYGEDYETQFQNEQKEGSPGLDRSFARKPKWAQAIVLVAGVTFNIIFAWFLISIGFMSGLPSSVSGESNLPVENARLTVTSVLPQTPASEAGLEAGDVILSLSNSTETLDTFEKTNEAVSFIGESENLKISIMREEDLIELEISPTEGILEGKNAIGITMDMIGITKVGPFRSLWEGAKMTIGLTGAIAVALWHFIISAFSGGADLSQVAGPIGIVSLVGDASSLGLIYLLSFTAFISIHLAIINLVPFPALDGGRLLFVLIEKLKGSPINPKVANSLNVIGFSLLILLMIVITISDVVKLI